MDTIEDFKRAIANDHQLGKELEQAENVYEFLKVASRHGFDIDERTLCQAVAHEEGELSDEQLEQVAGGISFGPSLGSFPALSDLRPFPTLPGGIVTPNC